MDARAQAVLVVLGSLATLPLLVGTTFLGFNCLIVPIFALTLAVGWGCAQIARDVRWLVPALVVVGVAVAVICLLTGILNGLSDEPYSTPAYASLGWSLYARPVAFSYVQYGTVHFENSYDVYLPLLTFVQVPDLDYRWVSLAAWLGAVYFLRKDPLAAAGFSTAWIPLLAANGQNDFVPLFALTLALVVPLGTYRWPAEVFALALKQLANVVIVGYHLARRQYGQAALAVVITAAILAPFVYLDPGGVWCHVIVGDPGASCMAHPWTFFVFKRNYWLYPSWVGVVYFRPLAARAVRAGARGRAFLRPDRA
jgi:hypothetical protein